MLPAHSRLRAAADFRSVMRGGVRSGRRTIVVHMALTGDASRMAGFAVSKAVGGAVVRNRVKRQLRAITFARLDSLPAGTRLVIRALPAAATASFAQLSEDVADALAGAARKVTS